MVKGELKGEGQKKKKTTKNQTPEEYIVKKAGHISTVGKL